MKKTWLGLLSVLMATTAIGGAATLKASAAVEDVPEALTVSNIALGKTVSYRSLTDMNTTLDAYAYFPDGNGDAFPGSGSGAYNISWGDMSRLTDGNAEWMNFKAHSTAPGVRGWAYLDLGESVAIDNIKVGYLAAWCFTDVVIQVSNDATFATGVTTVFSACASLSSGETIVYDGGQVGCTAETKAETGWNGFEGVDSVGDALRTYEANNVKAQYVRLTCNTTSAINGGATDETVFNEIQVYTVTDGVIAPTASVEAGTYESMTSIELSSGYDNAEIYYTLDGTYPTKNSTKYEGAIDVSAMTGSFVLRAIAVVDGKSSEAADYIYKIATPSENKALGKTVSFRSLTDMNTTLDAYAYFPDGNGDAFPGSGSGAYNISWGDMGRLTDGNAEWMGFKAHSTAPGVRGWAFLDLGAEIAIDNIKVGYLSGWVFTDVVIQVSNDATFATGVTTVFAVCDSVSSGETVVYNGGQVGCTEDTKANSGWNGFTGVNSVGNGLCTYAAGGVTARYVRLTCNTTSEINGGATDETVFNEIQVWSQSGVGIVEPEIKDALRTITEVPTVLAVVKGTDIDGVKAQLPTTLSYTTMAGVTGEVELVWENSDFVANVGGDYTFTANVPAIAVEDAFDIVPEVYTVTVKVSADTTALETLITETKAMKASNYTVASWNALTAVITAVEETLADESVVFTEEMIAEYTENITTAKAALVSLTELKLAIAGTITEVLYTEESVQAWKDAKESAKAVLADEDATVEEVTAAIAAINTAKEALVLIPEEPDSSDISSDNSSDNNSSNSENSDKEEAKSGCGSVVGGGLALTLLGAVAVVALARRKEE